MEFNKILFIATSALVYTMLSAFIIRIITFKFRKTASSENDFNYYGIILSALLLVAGILGQEEISTLKDVYEILQKNNSQFSDYFKIVSVFTTSAIFVIVFIYYLAFVLLQIIFNRIKICNYYNTEQYGYFLLVSFIIVTLGLILCPLYEVILVKFSPVINTKIYN